MKIFLLLISFLYLLANQNIAIQLNWKYQFEFAGFIMAKEKGFYKERGFDVKLKEINNNTNVVNYVLQNPHTYGVGDSSIISVILDKKPISLLMPIYTKSAYVLTAVNLPKVKTLKDIQKYDITLDQFAINNPVILAMLKSQGLDINKLHIIEKNFYDINKKGVFALYESNKIYDLKKQNIPYTIFRPSDYGFDSYGDMLFTSQKEVATYPNEVKSIIKATQQGYIYAFNHINETINVILKKYNTQHLTKDKLLFEANFLKDYLSRNFKFNINKLQNIKNIYVLLGRKNVDLYKYISNTLQFSKLEQEFIKTHLIKVISTDKWEPFHFMKNGELEGISVDYWKYIKEKANLKAKCFVVENWKTLIKTIKTKQADIVCATTTLPKENKYFLFSKPYMSFPIVVATRNNVGFINDMGLLDGKSIVIGKNNKIEALLKQHYPNLNFLEVKNVDKALKLVSEGKAFGALDVLPVIAYKINEHHYANLKISGKTPFNFDVRFMVRKDYPELISIINKVIDYMPKSYKSHIYRKWISVQMQKGYSNEYIKKIIILSLIIVILILIIIIYLIRNIMKRTKIEKELENLATIDKLTSIFNRYKIDMALNEQIEIAKRYKRPMSVIFFDIDHFKQVNDLYGHRTGDLVLIELSKLINQYIRKSDIFGRWGGEEFLIILPETSLEKAVQLAEKLRKVVEKYDLQKVPSIQISVGVTQLKNNDTITSLLTRVDNLLYKSKKNGRNQVNFE